MAVSLQTRVLHPKVGVFPPVCHTAVKLYHGDHQDETGVFPTASGIFPDKKQETIDLETVVCHTKVFGYQSVPKSMEE